MDIPIGAFRNIKAQAESVWFKQVTQKIWMDDLKIEDAAPLLPDRWLIEVPRWPLCRCCWLASPIAPAVPQRDLAEKTSSGHQQLRPTKIRG